MVRATVVALVTIAAPSAMASLVEAQIATREAVAIVVHPQVAVDDLSLTQLKSIFLAEQQHWQDRLADHAPSEGCDCARARPGLDRSLRHERGPLPTILDREDVSQRGGVGAQNRVQHRHAPRSGYGHSRIHRIRADV